MFNSWRGWLTVLVALLISVWIVGGSESFQSCMHESNNQAAQDNALKSASEFFAAVSVYKSCTGHFVEENGEAIIAGFTVILAMSTIGLWLATNKLWAAGEKQFGLLAETAAVQSRDMQASIAAAERSASAAEKAAADSERAIQITQRARVAFVMFRSNMAVEPTSGQLIGYNIDAIWENRGMTAAVNGDGFREHVWTVAERLEDVEFPQRPTQLTGNIVVGPGTRVSGKEIAITFDEMVEILEQRKRLLFLNIFEYDDEFPGTHRHKTEVCVEISVQMRREHFGQPNTEPFKYHAVYSSAT